MQVQIEPTELFPVVLVTALYFILYYCFLFTQSYSKVWLVNLSREGKGSLKYENLRYSDPTVASIKYGTVPQKSPIGTFAVVMDRTIGNYLEQMGPLVRPPPLGFSGEFA